MARYKTYHGRPRRTGIKIAVLIAILAGVGCIAFFVVPNYISYDADGNISIDLPFLKHVIAPPSPSPSPSGSQLVIDSPSPSADSTPSPEDPDSTPSPTPQKTDTPQKQLYIPSAKTKSEPGLTDLRDKALAEGYDGVVIEFKGEGLEGEQDLAMNLQTAAMVMEVFAGTDLELTALISACVDNEKPRLGVYTAMAVKHQSGQNFWDRNQNRWFNLYHPDVPPMIIGLCRDALEAGFDRVLLSNIGFPYQGGVEQINYGDVGEVTHTDAVNAFLTQLRAELGADAALDAVLFPETAVNGAEETAGQNAQVFKETFDRLYVFDGEIPVPSGYIPILDNADPDLLSKTAASRLGHILYSETGIY